METLFSIEIVQFASLAELCSHIATDMLCTVLYSNFKTLLKILSTTALDGIKMMLFCIFKTEVCIMVKLIIVMPVTNT